MSKSICSLVLPLCFVVAGCSSSTTFQDAKKERAALEKPTGGEKKSPSLQSKELQPGVADLGEDQEGEDGETHRVSKPVEVSGSFLACIPTKDDEFGCAVVDRGRKRDLDNANMTWYGFDKDDNDVALHGRRAAKSEPFHAYISSRVPLKKLAVVIIDEDGDEESYETRVSEADPGEAASDEAVHLGNGDFRASTCVDDLATVPTFGDRIRFGVETDRKGPWLIRLGGICGVDDTGRLAIRVISSAGTYQTINQGAESELAIWVPDVGAQWTVEVAAQAAPGGDIEDFLFTDLSILGAGDIVIKAR